MLSREDFDPFGLGFVVTQGHLLADEGDRGLKEFAVEADGAVFGDPPPGGLAEEVPEVGGAGRRHSMREVKRWKGVWPVALCLRW